MSCNNCGYHYADCDSSGIPTGNAYCHYYYNDGYAPCEVDDEYIEDEED